MLIYVGSVTNLPRKSGNILFSLAVFALFLPWEQVRAIPDELPGNSSSQQPHSYRSAAERDAIPYQQRAAAIISRMEANQLEGTHANFVVLRARQEAFVYAKKASANTPQRSHFGAELEQTQTWFLSEKRKSDGATGLFLHVMNNFSTRKLSGFLFELRAGNCRQGPPSAAIYYILLPDRPIEVGKEIVFVTALPENNVLSGPSPQCGTILEAW